MAVVHKIQATVPESRTNVSLTRQGLQRFQLGLEGRLEPGWAGRLSNGLAQRNINIVRVEAARKHARHWSSHIDLDFISAKVRPESLDYLALSLEPAEKQQQEPLVLDDFLLERSGKCDGSLYLEAAGPDRIGCLSALLNTFSLFSLFPAEMLVETQQKRIFDRFWLKGMGGSEPSPEAVAALKVRMNELLRGGGTTA